MFRIPLRLILRASYAATIFAILIAGFWPLNFSPKNQVEWLKGEGGLRFGARGMVLGTFPIARQQLTLEIRIRPFEEPPSSLPQILTVYSEHTGEEFFLGQWKSALVVRSRIVPARSNDKYREIGLDGALERGRERLITITSGEGGTAIYLDGMLGKSFPRFSLIPDGGPESAAILLGTSANGTSGLKGIIYGLAIYGRVLPPELVHLSFQSWKQRERPLFAGAEGPASLFLFDEASGNTVRDHGSSGHDLIIPETFKPLKRTVLEIDWQRVGFSWSFLSDFMLNIVGFMPFGLFQGALLLRAVERHRSRAYLLTFILGCALSLLIELVQVYLPTRRSDLSDLTCNIAGTLLGLLLLHVLLSVFPSCVRSDGSLQAVAKKAY
jgi:hypothetical protein